MCHLPVSEQDLINLLASNSNTMLQFNCFFRHPSDVFIIYHYLYFIDCSNPTEDQQPHLSVRQCPETVHFSKVVVMKCEQWFPGGTQSWEGCFLNQVLWDTYKIVRFIKSLSPKKVKALLPFPGHHVIKWKLHVRLIPFSRDSLKTRTGRDIITQIMYFYCKISNV